MQKTFRFKICGETWKFILQSPKKFKRDHGPEHANDAALTEVSTKKIYFESTCFKIEDVRHEVFHARFNYMCLSDAEIPKDQMEEVFANYIGKHGDWHVKFSDKIYRSMSRYAKKISAK